MKDFKLEDCIRKLETLNKEDRVGMVWQWTKQGNIDLTQFRKLLSYCLVSDKKQEDLSKFCISLYQHSIEQGYNPIPLEAQMFFIENYTKQ